jgi:hypothetical protein
MLIDSRADVIMWMAMRPGWMPCLVRDSSGRHGSMTRCWTSKDVVLYVSLWMDQSSWGLWDRVLGGGGANSCA